MDPVIFFSGEEEWDFRDFTSFNSNVKRFLDEFRGDSSPQNPQMRFESGRLPCKARPIPIPSKRRSRLRLKLGKSGELWELGFLVVYLSLAFCAMGIYGCRSMEERSP